MKPLIDWFDEHGPKTWDVSSGTWKTFDPLPSVVIGAPSLPVFDASNVAAMLDGEDQRSSNIAPDGGQVVVHEQMAAAYPNVRPPFQTMWVDYETVETYKPARANAREAWALGAGPPQERFVRPDGMDHLEDALSIAADLFGMVPRLPGPICMGRLFAGMSASGTLHWVDLHPAFREQGVDNVTDSVWYGRMWEAMEVLLFTLSMANARNIVQQVGRPFRPPRKKDKKPLPQREMRVLRLDGRYVERATAKGDGTATPKRLHRYRGHWKEYGMKPGQGLLFGKYKCRVYVPDGARGVADLGVVDKRYVVVPWPKTDGG